MLVLLCACLPFAWGANPAQGLEEGKKWFEQGQLDSAETALLNAIRIDPTIPESYYVLSEIYFRKYDFDKARENLTTAIELDQNNEEYRLKFDRVNQIASAMAEAMRSLNGGKPYVAISKFEDVRSEFPEVSPMALYHMGIASLRDDDALEAARYFREASREDPSYDKPAKALKGIADRIYNEGNVSLRRGNYEGAAENYEKVLELNPEYSRAHFQLGFLSTRLGEYEAALKHYEKAVTVDPSFAKGWFALGLALQRNGDFDKAIEALDSATEADPTHAKAHAQKGAVYLKQGDYASAEKAYEMAIQADPTYSKAYVDLGKIYVARKSFDEAVNTLTTATALDSKKPAAWSLLAQSHNALGQCEFAKEAALSALDAKEGYSPALFDLGVAEACLGNKAAALNAFEKARRDRSWRKPAEYEIDKLQHPERYEDR